MTKEEYFRFPENKRKQLINQAHLYYIGTRNINDVTDQETREFILMCENEQDLYAKRSLAEVLLNIYDW